MNRTWKIDTSLAVWDALCGEGKGLIMPRIQAKFSSLIVLAAALGMSPAHATVYHVDDLLGSSSVIGTITTNGATSIDAMDITSWDLTVKVGSHIQTILPGPGSTVTIIGGDLTATPTALDFPDKPGLHSLDFNDFPARSFFDIFVDIDIPRIGDVGGSTWGTNDHAGARPNIAGDLLIGQTPLPPALSLFATGLGAMGLFGWRRRRRNAAGLAAA
jgi:hypothetical protein